MDDKNILRREFLLLASTTPFALMVGCSKNGSDTRDTGEAFKTLILAVGPWANDRRRQAEDFATRFIAAGDSSKDILAQGETAKVLVSRAPFRDKPLALESLDLSDCSEAESNLLTSLVTKIYSLLEVHYYHVTGMPDIGVCSGREWYTLPPSEW